MANFDHSTGHDGMIHDAILDYYGRRMATCSSDKTIKIFEVEGDSHRLTETLKGHDGAVWSVAWAHPKYGTILASASYDGKVFIWREQKGQWQRVHVSELHSASVNMVSWAPHDVGCTLACASSDGKVSVLEFLDGAWSHQMVPADDLGVNAVSWAPSIPPGAIARASSPHDPATAPLRRFVTGGIDCWVRVWDWSPDTNTYVCTSSLSGHTDWVRDVAWSPAVLSKSYIASASQDKTVKVWTSANPPIDNWQQITLNFDAVAWHVSWSMSGNVLAVSTGDNKVSLWKEKLTGGWECVKVIEE